ncbi:MAG: hypothetical protein IT579_20165 [Verrucomicrobia subdivision 3 bacterium]|nr:hypothetical protein [Limisphaerales bacterium]
MAQKWYQKAGVQAAIVGALALIIVTLIPVALKVPRLESGNAELSRKLGEKTAEVQRLETLLAPFRTIALERYTGPENEALMKLASQIESLQALDREKTLKIEKLQSQLDKTSEQATPPTLSLVSQDTTTNGNACVVTLRFKPSKNQPLGQLRFNADLPIGTSVRITDFWPTLAGGPYLTGDGSKIIGEDGTGAMLRYSLTAAGYPTMELKLSGPSKVRISGEYIPEPIILDVK